VVFKTDDLKAVAKILNHPRVYGMISEDSAPVPFEPGPGFYIMNEEETGVVRIDHATAISCSAHIAAMPSLWGKARGFTKDALSWGFNNTQYTKVIALIPSFNLLALSLCDDCGFLREGLITQSYLKNWEYHDQVVFGITKNQFYGGDICHRQ